MRLFRATGVRVFPYSISFERTSSASDTASPAFQRHRRRAARLLLAPAGALLAVTAVLLFSMAEPAQADTSGSSTATVNVATRSVTVSPSTLTLDYCFDSAQNSTGTYLAYPNGDCSTSAKVTVSNGNAPGHIDVNGADAIPSDNGTHWTLCGGSGTGCGNAGFPGQDQFGEQGHSPAGNSPFLTTTPQCDTSFSASCTASSGQSNSSITLELIGPMASSDGSTSFSTVWTWTAAP